MPMGLPFSSRDYVDKYETSETAAFLSFKVLNNQQTNKQTTQTNKQASKQANKPTSKENQSSVSLNSMSCPGRVDVRLG